MTPPSSSRDAPSVRLARFVSQRAETLARTRAWTRSFSHGKYFSSLPHCPSTRAKDKLTDSYTIIFAYLELIYTQSREKAIHKIDVKIFTPSFLNYEIRKPHPGLMSRRTYRSVRRVRGVRRELHPRVRLSRDSLIYFLFVNE